jgi:hypothetical protein
MDYEQRILLDAVWFKLRNNEPMSTLDFRRLMDILGNASFSLESASEDEIRALQSQFISLLQKKFMQGG